MVVDGYVHNLTGLDELSGNLDIFSAWLRIAGGMLVGQDNRSRVGQYRRLEDLAGLHDRGGQAADADLGEAN